MSSLSDATRKDGRISIFIPYQRPDTFTPTPPAQSGLYWLFDLTNAPLVYLHRIGNQSEAGPAIEEIRRITHEQVDDLIDELVKAEEGLGKGTTQEQAPVDNGTTVVGDHGTHNKTGPLRSETSPSSTLSADADARELSGEEVDTYWDLDQAAEPQARGHRHESNRQCSSSSPMRSTHGAYERMRKEILTGTSSDREDTPFDSSERLPAATDLIPSPGTSEEGCDGQQEGSEGGVTVFQHPQVTEKDGNTQTWPKDCCCD